MVPDIFAMALLASASSETLPRVSTRLRATSDSVSANVSLTWVDTFVDA